MKVTRRVISARKFAMMEPWFTAPVMTMSRGSARFGMGRLSRGVAASRRAGRRGGAGVTTAASAGAGAGAGISRFSRRIRGGAGSAISAIFIITISTGSMTKATDSRIKTAMDFPTTATGQTPAPMCIIRTKTISPATASPPAEPRADSPARRIKTTLAAPTIPAPANSSPDSTRPWPAFRAARGIRVIRRNSPMPRTPIGGQCRRGP